MLTKGAIGNLVNRYRAVLTKCNLINTFGSLAVTSMLVLGGAGGAMAADLNTGKDILYGYGGGKIYDKNGEVTPLPDTSDVKISITDNNITATIRNQTHTCKWGTLSNYLYTNNAHNACQSEEIKIVNSIFENNTQTASGGSGGAITIWGDMVKNTTFNNIISQTSFIKNSANTQGGAVAIYDNWTFAQGEHGDDTSFIDCEFIGNSAGTNGGAITVGGPERVLIKNSSFSSNIAGNYGGALHVESETVLSFEGTNIFYGNKSVEGGAIHNTGTINFSDTTTFSGNTDNTGSNDIHNDGTLKINKGATVSLDGGITSCNGRGSITGEGSIEFTQTYTKVQANDIDEDIKAVASEELNDKLGGDYEAFKEQIGDKFNPDNIVMKAGMTAPGYENGKFSKNEVMDAALQQASITTFALDRILTNDVRKRLGDIRSDANTTGVWMRWDGGKLKGDSGLTNNFNTIQIGGDTKVAKNCRIGFAGSFTHGDMDFNKGGGELEGFSFALYGTWMGENGMFADVVARLGKFSTEMNALGRKGDMDNRVASLSGEYGWRFDLAQQFFIEPQVELAYTYVSSDDLQLGEAHYEFDSVDSLTGRAGVVAGWNLPEERGNIYARASVVQQFLGDAEITGAVTGGKPVTQKRDGEDTWLEYGIGANVKLTDNTYVWADVERTEGAEIEEEWRGTVGVRFSF